jgi:hypothetical protein
MKDKIVDIYRETDEDGNQHIYLCADGDKPPSELSEESIKNVATLERAGDILTYKCPFIVNMARMPSFRSNLKDYEGKNVGR